MAQVFIPMAESATVYQDSPKLNTGGDQQMALLGNRSQILLSVDEGTYSDAARWIPAGVGRADLWIVPSVVRNLSGLVKLKVSSVAETWDPGLGYIDDAPSMSGVNWLTKPPVDSTAPSAQRHVGKEWQNDLIINLTLMKASLSDPRGLLIERTDEAPASEEIYFYGVPTQTIYGPRLVLSWSDSIYEQDNTVALLCKPSDYRIVATGLPPKLLSENRYRVDLTVQPRNFIRTWNTPAPVRLPPNTYYRIRDVKTGFYLPTHELFSAISLEGNDHYFYLYTHGFPTGRYYQLDIVVEGVVYPQSAPFYVQ